MPKEKIRKLEAKEIQQKESSKEKNIKIQMDEICKMLFFSSIEMTLNIINYLFNENFKSNKVSLEKENTEFLEKDYVNLEVIRADFVVKVSEKKNNNNYYYHIEFQTIYNKEMNFRMLLYLLNFLRNKRKENKDIFLSKDIVKQYVVFFEENKNISDNLTLDLDLTSSFKKGSLYKVPALKFWEYDIKTLRDNKLYTLIPLKIFNYRKELENIKNRENNSKLLKSSFKRVFNTTREIITISSELYTDNIISENDFGNMLTATQNIFNHYYVKYYNKDENIKKEVDIMIKSVLEPIKTEGKMEGKIETILNILSLGLIKDNNVLSQITNLPLEEIIKIRKKYNK